jgi:hypothetical protein
MDVEPVGQDIVLPPARTVGVRVSADLRLHRGEDARRAGVAVREEQHQPGFVTRMASGKAGP